MKWFNMFLYGLGGAIVYLVSTYIGILDALILFTIGTIYGGVFYPMIEGKKVF